MPGTSWEGSSCTFKTRWSCQGVGSIRDKTPRTTPGHVRVTPKGGRGGAAVSYSRPGRGLGACGVPRTCGTCGTLAARGLEGVSLGPVLRYLAHFQPASQAASEVGDLMSFAILNFFRVSPRRSGSVQRSSRGLRRCARISQIPSDGKKVSTTKSLHNQGFVVLFCLLKSMGAQGVHGCTGQARPGQARPGQARPGQARPDT